MATQSQISPYETSVAYGKGKDLSMVFVLDDDTAMRQALGNLFQSVGLPVHLFASTAELLERPLPNIASCLILDVRLPGASGLELQTRLVRAGIRIPVIFVTGYGDIPMTVRAMKAGAVDFLTKPFREQDLLDAVTAAIERDRRVRQSEILSGALRAAFQSLSVRERQVMALVTQGLMNKQIAACVGLSEVTVKVHRSRVMKKMNVGSLADLVRAAEALMAAGVALDPQAARPAFVAPSSLQLV